MGTDVAAVDRRWALGGGKTAVLHSEDLHRFRALTEMPSYMAAAPVHLPGWAASAQKGATCLTHTPETLPSDAVGVRSVDALLSASAGRTTFCRGREMIYRQLLPFCRAAWITQVDADGAGDKFCDLDADQAWALADCGAWQEHGDLRYRFCCYKRKEL